jgi:hypothetical protein
MVYVPSNVVHSDWHVKGEYMTSMSTEPSHHGAADTVFLESDGGAKVYFQIE